LRENTTGHAPAQATTVRVRHDGAALHVEFACQDTEPWATITQRDGPLWEEEVVELFIDPVGDAQCYFEIEVNPLGTVLDLVLRKNRSGYARNFAWDCENLLATARPTTQGWGATLVIPFSSVSAGSNREWRVNFTRIDRPRQAQRELSAWSPTLLNTFHAPGRFGVLRFAE
jgi:hypothetical protein